MDLVPVYRFEYFNEQLDAWVVHEHFATAEVIKRLGGCRMPQTEALVHPSRLQGDGFVALVP
jgi:hypothetical protein